MLTIPEYGFSRSVEKHNCDLSITCDWIEASLLFDETEISQAKITDILHEQGFYPKDEESPPIIAANSQK